MAAFLCIIHHHKNISQEYVGINYVLHLFPFDKDVYFCIPTSSSNVLKSYDIDIYDQL